MGAHDLCATCGHSRGRHVYEEGACRPGWVCESGCEKFAPVRDVDLGPIPAHVAEELVKYFDTDLPVDMRAVAEFKGILRLRVAQYRHAQAS